MLKILVYTDERYDSKKSLEIGAELKRRLSAELAVITIRSQTPPMEAPPPIGVNCSVHETKDLPPGIRILVRAAADLLTCGLLEHRDSVQIRYGTNGYHFACNAVTEGRVLFYERYGNFIEVLNHEVTEHHYDLLIISLPRRTRLGRFVSGDTARLLTLNLHTSLFIVRRGSLLGRFMVCADGSPSSRRLFPLLQELLPAIQDPINLVWVRKPGIEEEMIRNTRQELERVMDWLKAKGCEPGLFDEEKEEPVEAVLELAGSDSTIVMGASLRHDVYRRMRGSFPLQILKKTDSSVLLVKSSQEVDMDADHKREK